MTVPEPPTTTPQPAPPPPHPPHPIHKPNRNAHSPSLNPTNSILLSYYSQAMLHTGLRTEQIPAPITLSALLHELESRHPGIEGLWTGGYRYADRNGRMGLEDASGGGDGGCMVVVGRGGELLVLGGGGKPVKDRVFRSGLLVSIIPGVRMAREDGGSGRERRG